MKKFSYLVVILIFVISVQARADVDCMTEEVISNMLEYHKNNGAAVASGTRQETPVEVLFGLDVLTAEDIDDFDNNIIDTLEFIGYWSFLYVDSSEVYNVVDNCSSVSIENISCLISNDLQKMEDIQDPILYQFSINDTTYTFQNIGGTGYSSSDALLDSIYDYYEEDQILVLGINKFVTFDPNLNRYFIYYYNNSGNILYIEVDGLQSKESVIDMVLICSSLMNEVLYKYEFDN